MYDKISININYLIKVNVCLVESLKEPCYSSFVNSTYMSMLKDGINMIYKSLKLYLSGNQINESSR